jgi:hypothetical protein
LFETPLPIVSEKRARLGRQVVAHGKPIAGAAAAYVRSDQSVIVVDTNRSIRCTQPQPFADQRERHGIQHALMGDMAVSVNRDLVPGAQIGGDGWQLAHQWPFDLEQIERYFACCTVDATPRFMHDPVTSLLVQIHEVAELAQRQEVAFYVFDAGFDDALLGRVRRRAGIDPETVPFRAFRVGALHDRVVSAGTRDRALGVVDDHARGHGAEPFEGATMAPEPSCDRLVPDELDVLMSREGKRHHERPRAPQHAVGVGQHRAGTEIDLRRFAGRKAERHGGLGRTVRVDRNDHAINRRIAAGIAVLTP